MGDLLLIGSLHLIEHQPAESVALGRNPEASTPAT